MNTKEDFGFSFKRMLGRNIRMLRTSKNITKNALAVHLNTSPSAVGYWEQGLHSPSAQHLVSLAEFFGVSSDEIVGLKS